VAVAATNEISPRIGRETVEGQIALMAPLIDQLQPFCCGHEAGDGGAAAAAMLGHVRRAWPEIPHVDVVANASDKRGAEELALSVVRDVGEVAGLLISASDLENDLAWARANLVHDLEHYTTVIQREA
jgi:hypothetical protein